MDWDALDDDTLGRAIDAWLSALRAQGLSARRIGELAGLLGEAMSEAVPKTPTQVRVLRRFEAWLRGVPQQNPPA